MQIAELVNMDVVIGFGKDINNLNIDRNTENMTIGEWYEYPVTSVVYVAAIPKRGEKLNSIKFNYNQYNPIPSRRDIEVENISGNIQLGITFGGLFIFGVVMLGIAINRRFKRKQMQKIQESQKDEDAPRVTTKGDNVTYSKIMDRRKELDEGNRD